MRNPSKLKASADAKREEPPSEREKLAELVKDSTDKNRQFFALYLGLWVYVLLMVFATTDQMLLVPTQGIKLPLIDITLPLLGFYVVAPLFLLAIHFNLLQNLDSHHYTLMRWRKVCGDIVPRQEIPAFLFNHEWLERGSEMEKWVQFVSRTLFLYSGPFALGILLWRFTDYQDITITFWHLVAFAIDSYLVRRTETAFKKNSETKRPSFDWPADIGRLMARVFGVLLLLPFGLALWFHFSSDGFVGWWSRIDGRLNSEGLIADSAKKMKEKTPWLHSLIVPIISIDKNQIAWLPEKKDIETQALLAGEKEAAQWWQKNGEGLNLTGRHLRGFSAPYAHLPKLKLDWESDLQGAVLFGAQMQGANFTQAKLQGANLAEAQLQGANLEGARLQGASLKLAKLQGANFTRAKLQGANLAEAQLQGANLETAKLQGADLVYTQLQGANLAGANLQGAGLDWVKLQGAHFGMNDSTGTKLQGANLADAELQGADLKFAKLQGAIFGFTELQKTLLPNSTEVVYWPSTPFRTKDADWKHIADMAQDIPSGEYRDAYVQRIKEAEARKELKEKDIQDVLSNHPEVVWETVIRDWDSDSQMDQESLLAAARGLQGHYLNLFKATAGKEQNRIYFVEINKAFCASKRLHELCAHAPK